MLVHGLTQRFAAPPDFQLAPVFRPSIQEQHASLEVHNLRKEFVRRDGARGRRRVEALRGVSFDVAARVCRDPRPERLGQVDAGPAARRCCSRTAAARVFGHDAFARPRGAQARERVSVEASFFKRCRRSRT